jgi:hypothetical protein
METKKRIVTRGFLSTNDSPTQNAVTMYSIYLSNLPKGWNESVLNEESVKSVRDFFGVDYGFDRMIKWGMDFSCSRSKTSSKRYISMNKAYNMAKSLLSMGMVITNKKLNVD